MKTIKTMRLYALLAIMEIFLILNPGPFFGWDLDKGVGAADEVIQSWRRSIFSELNPMDRLNEMQIIELVDKQMIFFRAMDKLKSAVHEKESQLKRELKKTNPDKERAANLKREICGFEARIYEMLFRYVDTMRAMMPNDNREFIGRGPIVFHSKKE